MSAKERVWRSQRYTSNLPPLMIVDSELAKASNIDGVQEMLNGCLCCTLVLHCETRLIQVGRMADALLELKGTLPFHRS